LVNWPSGEIDTLIALPTNIQIEIKEKGGYQIVEAASHKIYGCTDINSCSFNSQATIDDGVSCTYLPGGQLSGASESNMFKTETYSYDAVDGNELIWTVQNGDIVEGYGTPTIQIRWGIAGEGKVSVYEKGSCYGQVVSMPVTIRLDQLFGEHSVARIWNEALLAAIRGDYARPTIHARNLFHASVALYDAWAIYDKNSRPYLLGNRVGNFESSFKGFQTSEEKVSARNKTISYAAYRLLMHCFGSSPSVKVSTKRFDEIMNQLGYDTSITSTDYSKGNPAAMGNYIAQTIIDFGLQDGSRESTGFDNAIYKPVNPPLEPIIPGNSTLIDPNRWQPLSLKTFIDQNGHLIEGTTPKFLSPEWGSVVPFSLGNEDATVHGSFTVYDDPGAPPYLNSADDGADYKWNFSMVSIWGSHLNPYDGVIWDISPGSIGNADSQSFPEKFSDYSNFYKYTDGGDIGKGRKLNPVTGQPYEVELVPRGDYTRVLAEFWADGPNSETPPGHWFTILNYVSDHQLFEKKLEGKGEVLDNLEWDVKSYFILGGALHDAAIAAWGIKGYYDYLRPISAIRYLAQLGQSTDKTLKNYNKYGIALVKGYIEVVEEGDTLAGTNNENVGKIKLFTWKGHSYIKNTAVDQAGVGWILADNWWPYQRPSFVTPPFAGYISGHSTYSRAAAEVMTQITGSEYFPGGYGEFIAQKNHFLVFEEGPSVDVKLRWATYRDASDQCSLSRIWGGIHPPCDDIPGRVIGAKIGKNAVVFAKKYFVNDSITGISKELLAKVEIYPNPVRNGEELKMTNTRSNQLFQLVDIQGRMMQLKNLHYSDQNKTTVFTIGNLTPGIYVLRSEGLAWKIMVR
ncbi:MAG TPA: T9SS type A sorting domain-containing protein, partial [Prolixibacteraceae bacterium]